MPVARGGGGHGRQKKKGDCKYLQLHSVSCSRGVAEIWRLQ